MKKNDELYHRIKGCLNEYAKKHRGINLFEIIGVMEVLRVEFMMMKSQEEREKAKESK